MIKWLLVAVPALVLGGLAFAKDLSDCMHRNISVCTRIINSGSDDLLVRAYTYRGLAYAESGDTDRAIADYDQAIRLSLEGKCSKTPRQGHLGVCPDLQDLRAAYEVRGRAYNDRGDTDRAIADYDRAILLNPGHVGARFDRAKIYAKRGNVEKALIDFRYTARIVPAGFPVHIESLQQIAELEAKLKLRKLTAAPAPASENLALSGDKHWVAVAMRQNLDEAIRNARGYAQQNARVVKTRSGWYGVVLGPYATSDMSSFLSGYRGPQLPADAVLTRGLHYVETIWQPTSASASATTTTTKSRTIQYKEIGGKTVELSQLSDGCGLPRSYAEIRGKIVKVTYREDALTIKGFVLEEQEGTRSYINVDSIPKDTLSMAALRYISSGLQFMIHEGRNIRGTVELCGAAGRVWMLDSVRLETASPSPSPTPKPPPAVTSRPPFAGDATSARIKLENHTANGRDMTIISIEGSLDTGDDKLFVDAALRATDATIVVLNSPGGDLLAGIKMGEAIRLEGFSTLVVEGSICTSACALAWLGGLQRLMEPRARIGFHAAYNDDPDQSVTSVGNALVGAYLNKLGLSADAISFMTEAQPDGMQWLTFAEASRIGLDVKEFTQRAER